MIASLLSFRWQWFSLGTLVLITLFIVLQNPVASRGENEFPRLDVDLPGNGLVEIGISPGSSPSELISINSEKFFTFGGGYPMLQLLANGSLDSTFGDNGIVRLYFGTESFVPHSAIIEPNGFIVVAGALWNTTTAPPTLGNDAFVVTRLTPTGELDLTFGEEGLARIPPGTNPAGKPIQLIRQQDGKLLILNADELHISPPTLYRLHPNGTIDTGFGIQGSIPIQMDIATDIALQSNGIVVLGTIFMAKEGHISRVQRYSLENGTLDSTFGEAGTQSVPFPGADSAETRKIKVAHDDVIALLSAVFTSQQPVRFGVAKLTPNGALDSTFNQNGIVILSPPDGFITTKPADLVITADGITMVGDGIYDNGASQALVAQLTHSGNLNTSFGTEGFYKGDEIAHLSSGNIILAKPDGEFWIGGQRANATILNLSANGTPDYTFGPQGYYTLGRHNSIHTERMVRQPDGKILIYSPTEGGTLVFRTHFDGTRDTSYGINGMAAIPEPGPGNSGPSALGAALDPQNRLMLAGYSQIADDTPVLTRVLENGAIDTSFGENGYLYFGVPNQEQAHDVAVDANGKFVVIGRLRNSEDPNSLIIRRLVANGSPDTGFGNNGAVTIADCPAVGAVYVDLANQSHISILPDGDLLIAAYCDRGPNSTTLIFRLNADGTFDTSYGNGGQLTLSIPIVDWHTTPDGAITLLHDYYFYNVDSWIVSRYTPQGIPDTTFGSNGQVSHPIPEMETHYPKALAQDSTGNYLLLGSEYIGNYTYFDTHLARLLPDGNPDPNFGTDGLATFDLGQLEILSDVAIQDNYTMLTGPLSPGQAQTFGVVRLLLNNPPPATPTATTTIPTSTPGTTPTAIPTTTATATPVGAPPSPTPSPTSVPPTPTPLPSGHYLYLPITQR